MYEHDRESMSTLRAHSLWSQGTQHRNISYLTLKQLGNALIFDRVTRASCSTACCAVFSYARGCSVKWWRWCNKMTLWTLQIELKAQTRTWGEVHAMNMNILRQLLTLHEGTCTWLFKHFVHLYNRATFDHPLYAAHDKVMISLTLLGKVRNRFYDAMLM